MLAPTIQLLSSAVRSHDIALTVNEALSGIFGSISLASWIFLLLPQLLENYRNQSAEAVSLPFIFIWFIGDVCNLVGGLWADLVPVVVAIGGYFCISDLVMLSQTLYYGIRNRRREGKSVLEAARSTISGADLNGVNGTAMNSAGAVIPGSPVRGPSSGDETVDSETSPLIRKVSRTASITTIPGSTVTPVALARRRSSDVSSRRRRSSQAITQGDDHLAKILEESDSESGARFWLKNIICVLAVCAIGTVGWALAYESGAWTPTLPEEGYSGKGHGETHIAKGAQVLGYASAVLYLCARIPQIVKNWRDQSCEGLSLLFFILSLLGNLTYGAGIIAHSTQRDYIIKNVPWLIGSLGTMAEDIIIFVQFHLYRDAGREIALLDDDDGI